ncbi:MAG: MFS transporter [Mycobacterium sp.]
MRSTRGRYVVIICALAALTEALFKSTIAPMLPSIVRQFSLSHTMGGVLVAAFAIGFAVGTYPALQLTSRIGPRATTMIGIACVAAGTLCFAMGGLAGLLFAGRGLAGFGSVVIYSGGIALAMTGVGDEHRGATIGTIYSGSYAGAAIGPLIGTAATVFGRMPVFGLLASAPLAVTALLLRLPTVPAPPAVNLAAISGYLRSGRVRLGLWITSLPAFGGGVIVVSGAYLLDEAGASALMIGIAFGGMAVLTAILEPILGRVSDKWGRPRPLLILLLITAIAMSMLIPIHQRAALVVLIAIAGSFFSVVDGPGFALVGDGVESLGGSATATTFLVNLSWGPFAALGAILAGVCHDVAGADLSFAVLATVAAVSAGIIYRRMRTLKAGS